MNFSQYFNTDHPYFFYLLGGVILLAYIFFSRRNLKDLGEDREINNQDISGEEEQIPKGIEHFTSLDKTMQWKVVLLVVLMIIGLYLVVFQGPTINKDSGSVKSNIEQGQ
jgi:FtsH-binding integral membrane protein